MALAGALTKEIPLPEFQKLLTKREETQKLLTCGDPKFMTCSDGKDVVIKLRGGECEMTGGRWETAGNRPFLVRFRG
jgi:hypothetical protein